MKLKETNYFFLKSRAQEFIQYLLPVFVGPSLNKCPRWPPHFLQMTSVLCIPCEKSSFKITFSLDAEESKLGHPVPESNLVSELKSSVPQPAQTYIPFSLVL